MKQEMLQLQYSQKEIVFPIFGAKDTRFVANVIERVFLVIQLPFFAIRVLSLEDQ